MNMVPTALATPRRELSILRRIIRDEVRFKRTATSASPPLSDLTSGG
ncbi:MAG: hypothetical protein KGJ23_02740 [Euryarchaeota archaeon]|nr:hypothetical protein [Euryarchaeota archaeon]MDE1879606.1 hypothetical protein [Euryarchaeota archaeon]MDE2043863.1 hypothetical protein [Thermoplasmata archaeon]